VATLGGIVATLSGKRANFGGKDAKKSGKSATFCARIETFQPVTGDSLKKLFSPPAPLRHRASGARLLWSTEYKLT
jgi:hypothetical protein